MKVKHWRNATLKEMSSSEILLYEFRSTYDGDSGGSLENLEAKFEKLASVIAALSSFLDDESQRSLVAEVSTFWELV